MNPKQATNQTPPHFNALIKEQNEKEEQSESESETESEEEEEEEEEQKKKVFKKIVNEEEEESESESEEEEEEEEDEEEAIKKMLEELETKKKALLKKKKEKEEAKKIKKWLKENPNPKENLKKILKEELEGEKLNLCLSLLNKIDYTHTPPQEKKATKSKFKKTNPNQKQEDFLINAFKNNTALRCLYCKKTYISKEKDEEGEPIPTKSFKGHLNKCMYKKNGKKKECINIKDEERRRS